MAKKWKPTEEALLLELYNSGKSIRQIARTLDRSESSAKNHIHKLRQAGFVATRPWSAVEDTFLIKEQGKRPWTEIAKALDRNMHQVKERLSTLQETKPNRRNDILFYNIPQTERQHTKESESSTRFVSGKRKDLGPHRWRSSWEINFARILNLRKIPWKYEVYLFTFDEIKKGTKTFLVDFYLPKDDLHVEVKGQLTQASRTKTKRLAKYYPDEFAKLKVVVAHGSEAHKFYDNLGIEVYEYYDKLRYKYKDLINWEGA